MRHLSIRTAELPHSVVLRFTCPYEMGDEFVNDVSDVNCKSCKKQIREAKKEHVS